MQFTLNGTQMTLKEGQDYRAAAETLLPGRRALAVRVNGSTLPLSAVPREGEQARLLTYADEEGRRVYERSLRFVFLCAARRALPGVRMRVEHSIRRGIYIVPDAPITQDAVDALKREMRAIVAADLPFEKRAISREDATALFRARGDVDKVRLLHYRPYEHFQLYECDGMPEYFYGEMVPSTGYVPVFDLRLLLPGLALLLPDRADPSRASRLVELPKLMRTFAESARWNEILGISNVADLNEMIEKRTLREFIRVNEELHEISLVNIAQKFLASGARLILVAGPSSSGKTTMTHRLSILLRAMGHLPMKISLDDYYLDRDAIPVDENGERDLENPDTLDLKLLGEHLVALLQGEEIEAPQFDFVTGKRSEKTHKLRAGSDQPILIEGIHALNDRLTSQVPREMKFMIYISALTTINLDDHNRIRTTDARLLRRMVRDSLFRGTPPDETMDMWDSVRAGEEKYIFPYQERADVMFNSSLSYELAILKKYAYPMLAQISPESRNYTLARRLVKFLNYVHTADVENEIPINSILREFIGGCCFYQSLD